MNLILLDPGDFADDPSGVRLSGRRADHIRSVLRAEIGGEVRVGLLNGRLGSGRVTRVCAREVQLDVTLDRAPPVPSAHLLILGLPRPKALRRTLVHAVSCGVKRIVVLNCFHVDKSYWRSPLLSPGAVDNALRTGLEQAGDTVLPRVEQARRFKPFVEDVLPGILTNRKGFVATPAADTPCPAAVETPAALAVGPDRGFTEYEVHKLVAAGMSPVSLGPRTLRVETAVPALLGRIG